MKELIRAMIIAGIVACAVIYIAEHYRQEKIYQAEKTKFYDGEGNEIPLYAVKLLVLSQYVVIEHHDADTLTKYFYVKN